MSNKNMLSTKTCLINASAGVRVKRLGPDIAEVSLGSGVIMTGDVLRNVALTIRAVQATTLDVHLSQITIAAWQRNPVTAPSLLLDRVIDALSSVVHRLRSVNMEGISLTHMQQERLRAMNIPSLNINNTTRVDHTLTPEPKRLTW